VSEEIVMCQMIEIARPRSFRLGLRPRFCICLVRPPVQRWVRRLVRSVTESVRKVMLLTVVCEMVMVAAVGIV